MEFCVDLKRVKTVRQLHNRLKKYLPLPSYYGRNLDALADCLSEPHPEWNIVFKNWQEAQEFLKDYFDAFKAVLADSAQNGISVLWA